MKLIHKIQSCFFKIPQKYLLFLVIIVSVNQTFAQSTDSADNTIRSIIQIANIAHMVLTFLMTPLIILAGWLLSPDWTMGDIFGLRPYFLQVWTLVSNITYIIFAFLLFFMAVMQIFSGESKYAFKTKLPRFLVGILIVPFSWLIVSWTLSIANQLTAAVLSIPAGAIEYGQSDSGTKVFLWETIPTEITLEFEERGLFQCMSDGYTAGRINEDGNLVGRVKCISPAQFISENQSGPYFILLVYAYDIFRIQDTDLSDMTKLCGGGDTPIKDKKSCVKQIGDFLQKVGLALVTYVFFAFLVIALCFVLLARALKLWIYIMLSPLFGLAYALSDEGLGKVHESEGSGGGSDGIKIGKLGLVPFFKLAMVPVLVTAVLAFGVLFLGVMRSGLSGDNGLTSNESTNACLGNEFTMVKFCLKKKGEAYSSYLQIGNDRTAQSTITFLFGTMLTGEPMKKGLKAAGDTRDALTDIFAKGILSIVGLAIIWAGIKAAVNYDSVTEAAFKPFAKLGDAVGYAIKEAPSYIPLPHPALNALRPSFYEGQAEKIKKDVYEHKELNKQKSLAEVMGTAGIRDVSAAADNFAANKNTDALKEVTEGLGKLTAAERASERFYRSLKDKFRFLPDISGLPPSADKTALEQLMIQLEGADTQIEAMRILNLPENKKLINKIPDAIVKDFLTQIRSPQATSAGSTGGNNRNGIFPNIRIDASTKKIFLDQTSTPFIDGNSGHPVVDKSAIPSIYQREIMNVFGASNRATVNNWTETQDNEALKKILGDVSQPVISGFDPKDRKKIVLDLFDSQNSTPPSPNPGP